MAQDKQDTNDGPLLSQEDALRAMAAGQELSEQPRHEAVQAEPDVSVPLQAARAQATKSAPQANAHNFKKMMIPLLIVVGGLLLLMGGTVVFLDAEGTLRDGAQSGPIGGPLGRVLVYSAFPLGIFLLAGAWLFHREVRRTGKPVN